MMIHRNTVNIMKRFLPIDKRLQSPINGKSARIDTSKSRLNGTDKIINKTAVEAINAETGSRNFLLWYTQYKSAHPNSRFNMNTARSTMVNKVKASVFSPLELVTFELQFCVMKLSVELLSDQLFIFSKLGYATEPYEPALSWNCD